MLIHGGKCSIYQVSFDFLNEFILTLTFYHLCEMFISAYINVSISTNFNVFYSFPMVFPTYPSEKCQFKSQHLVPTRKMLAKHPGKEQNASKWYNLLLAPRWLHYHILGMPEGFPEEKRSHCELIQPSILTFKGTK